jgi:hypothetical protein
MRLMNLIYDLYRAYLYSKKRIFSGQSPDAKNTCQNLNVGYTYNATQSSRP